MIESIRSLRQILKLGGELTIYRAEEIQVLLNDALAGKAKVDLDLSDVTELDSAGVQILVAAQKAAAVKNYAMQLHGCEPGVIEVFEALGVAAYFGYSGTGPK